MKIKILLRVLSFFLLWKSYGFTGLIISEVFVDGTDEFIEIYNESSDFSWTIILEWAKSTAITLSNVIIPSNSFYLLGDNGFMLQEVWLQKSGLSLNLLDTNAIVLVFLNNNRGTISKSNKIPAYAMKR